MRREMLVAQAGQVIADRYRLEEPLGRGGMGRIWRAHHLRLNSKVALKFLDPSIVDSADAFNRFVLEGQAAAVVRSAHVVQVFDSGVDGAIPYISMELLEGESLGQRLFSRTRLTAAELDRLFSEVAEAVDNAHALGVIHRDLKPGNIFIAREGDREISKVLDFGIAKLIGRRFEVDSAALTSTGTMLGTPHYMSPEQVRGSRGLDERTDLWSLAIIAFECLTGELPFQGGTTGDVVVQICTEEPLLPSAVFGVPPGFDDWFLKGTRKQPGERFASARQMADSLSQILAPSLSAPTPAPDLHTGVAREARTLRSEPGSSDPEPASSSPVVHTPTVVLPRRRSHWFAFALPASLACIAGAVAWWLAVPLVSPERDETATSPLRQAAASRAPAPAASADADRAPAAPTPVEAAGPAEAAALPAAHAAPPPPRPPQARVAKARPLPPKPRRARPAASHPPTSSPEKPPEPEPAVEPVAAPDPAAEPLGSSERDDTDPFSERR